MRCAACTGRRAIRSDSKLPVLSVTNCCVDQPRNRGPSDEGAQDAFTQIGLHLCHGSRIDCTGRVKDETRRCGFDIGISLALARRLTCLAGRRLVRGTGALPAHRQPSLTGIFRLVRHHGCARAEDMVLRVHRMRLDGAVADLHVISGEKDVALTRAQVCRAVAHTVEHLLIRRHTPDKGPHVAQAHGLAQQRPLEGTASIATTRAENTFGVAWNRRFHWSMAKARSSGFVCVFNGGGAGAQEQAYAPTAKKPQQATAIRGAFIGRRVCMRASRNRPPPPGRETRHAGTWCARCGCDA